MRRERYLQALRVNRKEGQQRDSMLLYSGTPVYRFDWWSGTEFMLELSLDPKHVDMSRLNTGMAPITLDHIRYTERTIGTIQSPRLTPEGLFAAAHRYEDGAAAEAWAKVDAKVLGNLSVEVAINDQIDVTPKGEKLKRFRAIDWEPQAVSIVAVGADPKAQFLADQEFRDIWLPEEFRLSANLDAGAASNNNRQMLLHLLLKRRTL